MKIKIYKRQLLGFLTILFIIISTITTLLLDIQQYQVKLILQVDCDSYDVNEEVTFNCSIIGPYTNAFLTFGDGETVSIENVPIYIHHNYSLQGLFNPVLWAQALNGKYISKSIKLRVENTPADFKLSIPEYDWEGEDVEIGILNNDNTRFDNSQKYYQFIYNFADSISIQTYNTSISHSWQNSGVYPISVTMLDDQGSIFQKSKNITIKNDSPIACFEFIKDKNKVSLDASKSFDTKNDKSSLIYTWDFGDGNFGFGKYATHTYMVPRLYSITLYLTDDNGVVYKTDHTVDIRDISYQEDSNSANNQTLDILGPYNFPPIVEGNVVELNLEVYDTFESQPELIYSWYDEQYTLISHDRKPSVILDDGKHRFRLEVENSEGLSKIHDVSVQVNNRAPEVSVANYAYYGPPADKAYTIENSGWLKITAYGYDCAFDINNLEFRWKISCDAGTPYQYREVNTSTSTLIFPCEKNTLYRGQVQVIDPSGKSSIALFYINSMIDADLNGLIDIIDYQLDATGKKLSNFYDNDNDFLSDLFEQELYNTNAFNPDSDYDGLADGIDSSGVGELMLGTSALNPDTDNDGLNDGIEFYGWEISISSFEGTGTIHVSSSPFGSDTDGDSVSDYEEYTQGTNPLTSDSDGDGITDNLDLYPTKYDNDEDGLSDNMEKQIGSLLNNTDTDGDGLSDSQEFYGWGALGFQTSPINPDNDKDFVMDSAELKSYWVKLKNQNQKEIRVNVSHPVSLHFPHLFQKAETAQISLALAFGEYATDQSKEYGVKDENVKDLTVRVKHMEQNLILFESKTNKTRYFSHVIDITPVMNDIGYSNNYYGHYLLEVDDTTTGCLVEQFELQVCRYLDPHDEDFDDDGLLDGIEMNLLTKGKQVIDIKDQYNSSQCEISSTEFNSNTTRTFMLEIPYIGRVSGASSYMLITSEGNLSPNTLVDIKYSKKYLDQRKDDTILYHHNQIYTEESPLSKIIGFDLYAKWQYGQMEDIYGDYELKIKLESQEVAESRLILQYFYIETDTYIEAGPLDEHVWLTDPALSDTDADGWNDYYEIYTSGSNPLQQDTDGDGALDPFDRDPLRNIIIEISPISASYRNQAWPTVDPELQIVMYLTLNDLIDPVTTQEENKVGLYTPTKKANTDLVGGGLYWTHQTAWWCLGEEHHYYVDVPDDITKQSGIIPFHFTLWEQIPSGDLNRFDEHWYIDNYELDSATHPQTLTVYHLGNLGNFDEINIEVKKIAVEKANTIAIFSLNETQFNRHYQLQERMNLFQLHIIDDGPGTPFVKGINTIVIPTSLFDKTELNAYIEHDRLHETPLYSDVEGEFEFYSIDRDGCIVEDACGDTDFIFVRYGLTSQEAMVILSMLLIGAENQTTNELDETITTLGTIYSYTATKINGTNPALLNVPDTLSKFMLWKGSYENSPFGPKPEPFNPFFLLLVLLRFHLPPGVILMIFTLTIISLTFFNSQHAQVRGLTILTVLGHLIWCLIRAALIIVAYIALALELLTVSIIFLGIGAILTGLSPLMGMHSEWGINWAVPYSVDTRVAFIELEMNDYAIFVAAYINWTYWEYFDVYFPLLTMDSKLGSLLEEFMEATNNLVTPPELGCGYDHLGGLRYDFHATYRQRPQGYAPSFVKLVLVSPSGNIYNYSMEPTPDQTFDSYYNWVRFNKTIDFGEEFGYNQRQGQWHYYFITQATMINTTTRWPYCGYAIGPLFHDNRSYLFSSSLDPFSGFIDSNFTFSVSGYDDNVYWIPDVVYLKIRWPNYSVQAFPMDLNSYQVVQSLRFDTYSKTLNFSQFLSITTPTTLQYYYEAIFSDESVSVLWDYETLNEDTYTGDDPDELYEEYEYVPSWFEGPLLKPRLIGSSEPPVIWDWYVEDLTWNRVLHEGTNFKVLSPVSDGFTLRFYVYIEDPDGDHVDHWNNGFEFEPQLILTNLEHPNTSLDPIPMKWTGGHYGPGPEGYDEYFVDLHGDGYYGYKYAQTSDLIECNFTSGAWRFAFEVRDDQNHITKEQPDKKLWHIGSFEHMINTFFYGYPTGIGIEGFWGSIAITIAYMVMTILAACNDPKIQIAAQLIAAGLAAVDMTLNILSFINFAFTTDDTGSLLGLGFHTLLKSIGFLIALKFSKNNVGSFSFNLLNKFSGYLMAITLLNMFCDTTQSIRMDTDENEELIIDNEKDPYTWDDFLGGYPMKIITFLSSVIGLTSSLVITSGMAKTGVGTENIRTIILIHTFISIALSSFCFITYFFKSGFIHIATELLFNT